MEPQGSIPHVQVPDNRPYPEPDQSSSAPTHILKIHFNIILPSTPWSPKWSLSFMFPHQNPLCTSPLPHSLCSISVYTNLQFPTAMFNIRLHQPAVFPPLCSIPVYTNLQFPTAMFNIRLHYPAVFPPLCSISVYTTLQYSHRYVQYPLVLWFHILQSRLHWVHWAIETAPKEPKISKHTVAGTTRDMIWTILDTLEIVRKPGIATSHSIIMAAYKIGLLTT